MVTFHRILNKGRMHVSEPAFAGWNDFGHFCDHVLRIKSAVGIDDQIIDYVAECCTLGEIYRVIEPSKGVLSYRFIEAREEAPGSMV